MAITVDYDSASETLRELFEQAEGALLSQAACPILPEIHGAIDLVFSSNTQAFREALLDCLLARISDRTIDIRKPYVSQGENAFNGRTLDEQVVNPALKERQIPSSMGPFLSVFRRSVEFTVATRDGVRDKADYDAFLKILSFIETCQNDDELRYVAYIVAYRFLVLREKADVPLTRIQRISLDQVSLLVSRLLSTQSGGRFPMYVIVAVLQVTDERLSLGWDIQWEGINVADSASGLAGDIVVSSGQVNFLVAEVTERQVDQNRVIATFNNKIGPEQIENYIFFVRSDDQPEDAVAQMKRYFAQGHDLNFVVVEDWARAVLATVGIAGRSLFMQKMADLLASPDTPQALKVAWNEEVSAVVNQ